MDTDNLPAMKDAPAPAEGVSVDVATAWQKLNEADGVIPYLDYTTPTFYDDISAAIQELLGGQAVADRVHRGRAGGVRQVGGVPLTWPSRRPPPLRPPRRPGAGGPPDRERPPGEPRLVGYLYLLPAFAVFAGFVLYPLGRAAWISLWDWDGLTAGHVGGARQLRRGLHRRGTALARSCTRSCCCSSTRCCRC